MFAPEMWTVYTGDGNGTVVFNEDGSMTLTGSNDADTGSGWGGGINPDGFNGYSSYQLKCI